MNGQRKTPKPTAKQANARLAKLEIENAMLRLDIEARTKNFLNRAQIFEGIFQSVLEQAATVGEARRWYDMWVADINAIDFSAVDQQGQFQAVMDKHGFVVQNREEEHAELIDNLWNNKE